MSQPTSSGHVVAGDDLLEDAARAAYTRPGGESTIPWERRRPHRQAYWRGVASRAVTAATRLDVVGAVVARHMPIMRPDVEEIACVGCDYVAVDFTDHGEHVAVWIRARLFGWPEEDIRERLQQHSEMRRNPLVLVCPRCGDAGRAPDVSDAPDDIPPAERDQWAEDQDDRGVNVCDMCGNRW